MEEKGKITVKPYLTYAQIQAICNAVSKFDSWAERQTQIDMLLLKFATNLTDTQIEKKGHEKFLCDGTIDFVKSQIKNLGQIDEALHYTESIQRAFAQILELMPDVAQAQAIGTDNASPRK